jgi:hypothetical protein
MTTGLRQVAVALPLLDRADVDDQRTSRLDGRQVRGQDAVQPSPALLEHVADRRAVTIVHDPTIGTGQASRDQRRSAAERRGLPGATGVPQGGVNPKVGISVPKLGSRPDEHDLGE